MRVLELPMSLVIGSDEYWESPAYQRNMSNTARLGNSVMPSSRQKAENTLDSFLRYA